MALNAADACKIDKRQISNTAETSAPERAPAELPALLQSGIL